MKQRFFYVLLFFSVTFYGQTIPIDPTFNQGGDGPNGAVNDFVAQPDGKIIIVGSFTQYNGVPRKCIARINPDGSLDSSFNPGFGAGRIDGSNPFVLAVELCPDGKILLGGNFEQYNSEPRKLLVRLNSDGSLDTNFNVDNIFYSHDPYQNGIHDIEPASDNEIFVCGSIGLVKLYNDGTHDASFVNQANDGILGYVTKVKVLQNGKLMVGGWDLLGSGFGRLNPDGSVDETFLQHDFLAGQVNDFYIEDNGKVLVGGLFLNETYSFLFRLNIDGAFDDSFTVHEVEEVQGQPNSGVYSINKYLGKTLVSGLFDSLDNSGVNDVALINEDGTVDNSFNTGEWPSRYIRSVFVQNSSNIIVATHYQNWSEPIVVPRLIRFGDGAMSTGEYSQTNGITVYTNDSGVNISSASELIMKVEMYDACGRLINSGNNVQSDSYSFLPEAKGVFFGRVETVDGKVFDIKAAY